MNRWLYIRRLRGPAFLILFGITALLNQWGVLSFGRSWPLYLILAGLLALAERAALAGSEPVPFSSQPNGSPYASSASPSYPSTPGPEAQLPAPGGSSRPGDDSAGENRSV
ncbi:MAG TPA: DUF5668 domain-containing protein [Acidobacteriaceae bacterium]|nr:DUF5668 domain-containing protein [Acidobacteriaceae bacterium]